MDRLRQSVVKTLCYFDLFEYPLTTFEVWKWLWERSDSYDEVANALSELHSEGKISCDQGFWFLAGRGTTVATRQHRHRLSLEKMKRAKRFARLFSLVPWAEGIAVCNSLGYRNASERSDIDFLIIVKSGAIWTTRAFVTGLAALLGVRPTSSHAANTICLSFFVTADAMSLETLKKERGDPYLTYWLTSLTPLSGRRDIWKQFWKANQWVRRDVPHALDYQNASPWIYKTIRARSWPAISIVEASLKALQRHRLPKSLQDAAASNGTDVIVSDHLLKFHLNDRREQYQELWERTVSAVQV